jgi:aspartyl-tRNA(Asn)/glutamyl-tRNA(Gln) amidotransferase subunit A
MKRQELALKTPSTLAGLATGLAAGAVSARALVEEALARIADPQGEGARVFVSIAADAARAQAVEADRRRAAGAAAPFAGIPLAIKDLFDVRGEVTRAGSRVLESESPALRDAPVIARLRDAGFVFVGRTNMTEFAYSGLGLNPHYGTPRSVYDRATGRIPGGSTSGGAVAIADGMAAASLGTDTGGSCRIPAAFNDLVGFKPTAHRVPRAGVLPLSHSLDSVGPLGRSVQCCATLDAILRGLPPPELEDVPLRSIRLLLPTGVVLSDLEDEVARVFQRRLQELARAGVVISERPLPVFDRIPQLNARGGLAAAEAYAWHKPLLDQHAEQYDPRVATRIMRGAQLSPADVGALHTERAAAIAAFAADMREFDAVIAPTTPILPPPLAALQEDSEYLRLNALVLRNPSLANFLDGCSISLRGSSPGAPPVGLMLIAPGNQDARLFAVASALERVLARD